MPIRVRSLYVAAATLCTTPCIAYASEAIIGQSKNISCTYGSYRVNSVQFQYDDNDQLIALAMTHQGIQNTAIINSFCADEKVPKLQHSYLEAINDRISTFNICANKEVQLAAYPAKWPAVLGILKTKGRIASDIAQIIQVAEFVDKFADESVEAFNSTEEFNGELKAGKGILEVVNITMMSGRALRRELKKHVAETAKDELKDNSENFVKSFKNPWELAGYLVKQVADKMYVDPMIEENTSFSHSTCR